VVPSRRLDEVSKLEVIGETHDPNAVLVATDRFIADGEAAAREEAI
jgi:hypothetical protein